MGLCRVGPCFHIVQVQIPIVVISAQCHTTAQCDNPISGRAKRLARLQRNICEPQASTTTSNPLTTTTVASSAFESAAAPPAPPALLSAEAPLVEPQISLRDYFPETWLFELGPVEGSSGLRRYLL